LFLICFFFETGTVIVGWGGRREREERQREGAFLSDMHTNPFLHSLSFFRPKEGKQLLLTKGDNNNVDDRGLYQELYTNRGMMWIEPKDIVGRVQGFLPYLGMFTIFMTDYPLLKYALLGGVGLIVFLYE